MHKRPNRSLDGDSLVAPELLRSEHFCITITAVNSLLPFSSLDMVKTQFIARPLLLHGHNDEIRNVPPLLGSAQNYVTASMTTSLSPFSSSEA